MFSSLKKKCTTSEVEAFLYKVLMVATANFLIWTWQQISACSTHVQIQAGMGQAVSDAAAAPGPLSAWPG